MKAFEEVYGSIKWNVSFYSSSDMRRIKRSINMGVCIFISDHYALGNQTTLLEANTSISKRTWSTLKISRRKSIQYIEEIFGNINKIKGGKETVL